MAWKNPLNFEMKYFSKKEVQLVTTEKIVLSLAVCSIGGGNSYVKIVHPFVIEGLLW